MSCCPYCGSRNVIESTGGSHCLDCNAMWIHIWTESSTSG